MSYFLKNSTFENFLEKVRSRPGLFFGKKSLIGLWCFMTGYQQAVYEHEILESDQMDWKLETEFNDWLRKKFCMGNAVNWYYIIKNMTASDEEAWEMFFKLWDEFRS